MMKSYELFHPVTKEQMGFLVLGDEVRIAASKDVPSFWELRDGNGNWFAVLRDVAIKELPTISAAAQA